MGLGVHRNAASSVRPFGLATLDEKGKSPKSKTEKVSVKPSAKKGTTKISALIKKQEFHAALLAIMGIGDPTQPKPGMFASIPLTMSVGGRTFAGAVDVVYTGSEKSGKAKTPKQK